MEHSTNECHRRTAAHTVLNARVLCYEGVTASPQLNGIELQNRDLALLRGLFESRVMSLGHIAELYFQGKKEAAKKRVQKLKAAHLVVERPRRPTEPSILTIARSAISILLEQKRLDGFPPITSSILHNRSLVSPLTLGHELEVMNVKAAIVKAVNSSNSFRVAEFSTWPALSQFHGRRPSTNEYGGLDVLVKPDGFVRIQRENDRNSPAYALFLEVDRSTESLDTFAIRAACYADYYRTGGFAAQWQSRRPQELSISSHRSVQNHGAQKQCRGAASSKHPADSHTSLAHHDRGDHKPPTA